MYAFLLKKYHNIIMKNHLIKKHKIKNKTISGNKDRSHKRCKKIRTQKKHKNHKGGLLLTDTGRLQLNTLQTRGMAKTKAYQDLLTYTADTSKPIIELVSHSSVFGFIFRVTLRDDAYQFFMDSTGVPIKKFLVKVSFLNDDLKILNTRGLPEKQTMPINDFENEYKNHKNIYIESILNLGMAIVPDVNLSGIIVQSMEQAKEIFSSVTVHDQIKATILKAYYDEALRQNVSSVGFYYMKYADGFNTYDEIIQNSDKPEFSDQERFLKIYQTYHIVLGMLGYVHGDAHPGNIMIDTSNNSALLIDFGHMIKINIFQPNGSLITHHNRYRTIMSDDIIALSYITTIISYIKEYCDLPRLKHQLPKNEWACFGMWYKVDINRIDTLKESVRNLFDYFIRNTVKNIPEIQNQLYLIL